MKRREFIVASALSAALLAGLGGCSGEPAAGPGVAGSENAGALDALARRVKGFDADALPAGRDPLEARDRLLGRLAQAGDPGQSLEAALQAAIREDHAQGRTEEVDGWVLADTELDLLVYSASLHRQAGASTRLAAVTPATATLEDFVTIKAWGPQRTCAGSGFNVQSDGHSSLWLQLNADAPVGLVVLVAGREVLTTQANGLVTTRFYARDLERDFSKPGSVRLELFHPGRGIRQVVGEFTVTEGGEFATTTTGQASTVFRKVDGWGPRQTGPGQAFNPQGEHDSALWISTACAPRDTRVRFGTELLDTQVGPDTVTARLRGTKAIAAEGSVPVHLVDTLTGEEVLLGTFQIAR